MTPSWEMRRMTNMCKDIQRWRHLNRCLDNNNRLESVDFTCRFFLQTLTAAKASCICFLRASLWRLYAISMKMRKIPAAMPPATSMNTPGRTERSHEGIFWHVFSIRIKPSIIKVPTLGSHTILLVWTIKISINQKALDKK